MELLILGGTRFVGRHLVTAALARNHNVTLFNRGKHPSGPITGVETIHGDRDSDLDKLRGRHWDTVIDTCGYLPRTVRASAESLSESIDRYVFISSISVYADLGVRGLDETASLATLTNKQLEAANAIDSSGQASAAAYGKMYGGLKALCEKVVQEVLPTRALIVRPALIVGPDDYTDRFTYWVQRVARGGEVLAPARPDRQIQFIDARDLAEWIVAMVERKETGVFNAAGPVVQTVSLASSSEHSTERRLQACGTSMGAMLEECRVATDSDASFTWVSEEFLLQEKVVAWSEMPLWLPEDAAPHLEGFMFINCDRAVAAGLTSRPLRETIRDTLTWREANGLKEQLKAGIDPDHERRLLQKWRETVALQP